MRLVCLEIPEPGANGYQNLMRQNPKLTRSRATKFWRRLKMRQNQQKLARTSGRRTDRADAVQGRADQELACSSQVASGSPGEKHWHRAMPPTTMLILGVGPQRGQYSADDRSFGDDLAFLSCEREGFQVLRGDDTACRPLVTTYTELDYDHLVSLLSRRVSRWWRCIFGDSVQAAYGLNPCSRSAKVARSCATPKSFAATDRAPENRP
jgi:hypothetical protein